MQVVLEDIQPPIEVCTNIFVGTCAGFWGSKVTHFVLKVQFSVVHLLHEEVLSDLESGIRIGFILTHFVLFLSSLEKWYGDQVGLRYPKTGLGTGKDNDLEDETEKKKNKSGENSSSELGNLLKELLKDLSMVFWSSGCCWKELFSWNRIFALDFLSVSPKISTIGKVGLDKLSSIKVIGNATTSTLDKMLVALDLIFTSLMLFLFTFGAPTTALLLFIFMYDTFVGI